MPADPTTTTRDQTERRVVVAGVSGVLGAPLARALAGRGWSVAGVARAPDAALVPGVEVHAGDLADPAVAGAVCGDADGVVFAAGRSGVAASFADVSGDLLGNALPWLNVLHACRPGAHVVLLSSQLVYGPARGAPFREHDRVDPQSPYALHRVLMEEHGRLLAVPLGLEVTVLRLGNVVGDIVDATAPRAHGVVPRLLRDLLLTGTAQLYGDGSQALDMLHADDLGRAVVRLLGEDGDRSPGEAFSVFNVSGRRLTVRQLAEALRDGLGAGATTCVPWPAGLESSVAKDIVLDDTSFRARYGWSPAVDVEAEVRRLARAWRHARGVPAQVRAERLR